MKEANPNIMICKVAWSNRQWKGFCEDLASPEVRKKFGFDYVKKLGIADEWWNFFDFDKNYDDEEFKEYYFGYFQAAQWPTQFKRGLVIFTSRDIFEKKNKFIGFYGDAEFGDFKKNVVVSDFPREYIDELKAKMGSIDSNYRGAILEIINGKKQLSFKLKAPKSMSTVFTPECYIDVPDVLPGQGTYTYLKTNFNEHSVTLMDIKKYFMWKEYLEKAIKCHSNRDISIKEKIEKVVKKYFTVNVYLEVTQAPYPSHIGKILWAPFTEGTNNIFRRLKPGDVIVHYITSKTKTPEYKTKFVGVSIVKSKEQRLSKDELLDKLSQLEILDDQYKQTFAEFLDTYKDFILVELGKFMNFDNPIELSEFKNITSYEDVPTSYLTNFETKHLLKLLELQGLNKPFNQKVLSDTLESIIEENLTMKKQIILYGPVGTGKTSIALEFARKKVNNDKNRLAFLTFHQSYSYEDFVEGIKPEVIFDNEKTQIGYFVKDGIIKKLAYRAICSALENCSECDDSVRDSITKIKKYLNPENNSSNSDRGFNYKKYQEFIDAKQRLMRYLQKADVEKLRRLFRDAHSYYLIIDEINRGNINNIFGELLTIIEADKRLGEPNQIFVTLPYSNELFALPPNLYIIGTMNTSDRSIALLDLALRRRFRFIEIEPNSRILDREVEGINLRELLDSLNKKIETNYDSDHRIGHSFLLGAKDIKSLRDIWYNEIIPLLKEFFYNEPDKLKEILGEFIESSNGKTSTIRKDVSDEEFIKMLKELVEKNK